MRIDFGRGQFSGLSPGRADHLLSGGARATVATNCRFNNGNLGSWNDLGALTPLAKIGRLVGLHLLDGEHWLHYVESELGPGHEAVIFADAPSGTSPKRAVITGLDVPRVTDVDLATTGGSSGEIPYATRKLGVPAPTDAPAVAVIPGDDSSEELLVNGGAEDGDTTGWTVDAGSLVVHDAASFAGITPFEGDYYFGFGDNTESRADQFLSVVDGDITEGQRLTLTHHYLRSTDGVGSGVTVFMTAYDSDDNILAETSSTLFETDTPNVWYPVEAQMIVPGDTSNVRVRARAVRGPVSGNVGMFIDGGSVIKEDIGLSFDGSSLEGWTTSTDGVSVNLGIGWPAPAYQMASKSNRVRYQYRDVSFDQYSLVTIKFRFGCMTTEGGMKLSVSIGAAAGGSGSALVFSRSDLILGRTEGWSVWPSGSDKILDGSLGMERYEEFDCTLTVERGEGTTAKLTITLIRETVTIVDAVERDIQIDGSFFGFQGSSAASNNDDEVQYDSITIERVGATGDTETSTVSTNYVRTFVNSWGQEGPPSPVSQTLRRAIDSGIRLTWDGTIPAEYGIENQRIYRLVSLTNGFDYRRVVELPIATVTYDDQLADDELPSDTLQTVDYDLPPSGGKGVIILPNGMMAMFEGDMVYFSVPSAFHAWPVLYAQRMGAEVVSICGFDTNVVVQTVAGVELLIGTAPENVTGSVYSQSQAGVAFRGAAKMSGAGVVFPTPDGLAATPAPGAMGILSEADYTHETWRLLDLAEIRAAVHDERYFMAFGDAGAGMMIFDPRRREGGAFVVLDQKAECLYQDRETDTLYIAGDLSGTGNQVAGWSRGAARLPYQWRSGRIRFFVSSAFRYVVVRAADYDDVTLRVYNQDGTLIYDMPITGLAIVGVQPARMMGMYVEIEGASEVESIHIGQTSEEMREALG